MEQYYPPNLNSVPHTLSCTLVPSFGLVTLFPQCSVPSSGSVVLVCFVY